MAIAQLQCFGCNKVFSPCCLSQHISKASNPCCRSISDVPCVSATIPRVAFLLGATNHQENFIGTPEPMGAMDTDALDNMHGDDEIDAGSGGESHCTMSCWPMQKQP